MPLSRFSGEFSAFEFAYGINPAIAPLLAINGPAATGAGTLTLAYGYFTTQDGTVVNYPLNTNAPITVGLTQPETVTPSSVSNSTPGIYGSPTVTATSFTYLHGNGDEIRSGTVGLQEAINYCYNVYGGGTVFVDARWAMFGGTSAMIASAVVPPNVTIADVRNGLYATARQHFRVGFAAWRPDCCFDLCGHLWPADRRNHWRRHSGFGHLSPGAYLRGCVRR